jgi:hypothetical protein
MCCCTTSQREGEIEHDNESEIEDAPMSNREDDAMDSESQGDSDSDDVYSVSSDSPSSDIEEDASEEEQASEDEDEEIIEPKRAKGKAKGKQVAGGVRRKKNKPKKVITYSSKVTRSYFLTSCRLPNMDYVTRSHKCASSKFSPPCRVRRGNQILLRVMTRRTKSTSALSGKSWSHKLYSIINIIRQLAKKGEDSETRHTERDSRDSRRSAKGLAKAGGQSNLSKPREEHQDQEFPSYRCY